MNGEGFFKESKEIYEIIARLKEEFSNVPISYIIIDEKRNLYNADKGNKLIISIEVSKVRIEDMLKAEEIAKNIAKEYNLSVEDIYCSSGFNRDYEPQTYIEIIFKIPEHKEQTLQEVIYE